MPHYRLFSTGVVTLMLVATALAQVPGPGSPPSPGTNLEGPTAKEEPAREPTEAEKLIDDAVEKVRAIKSVSARIDQKAKMFGLNFHLDGVYMHAPEHRVYLLLNLSGAGDTSGRMLQICDGQVLWDVSKILDTPESYRRLEIAPVLEKLNDPDCDPALREKAFGQMGFTGPEALLLGLRQAAEFNQKEEDVLDGVPVWVLRGRWKDRKSLTRADQPSFPTTGPLPPYVPSIVSVWVGKENGWPYKVAFEGRSLSVMELRKQDFRERGVDGQPVGRPLAPPPNEATEIVLTYSDVQLNPTLDLAEFAFTPPPEARVIDGTKDIVSQLTQALNERAAMRKAEAAREQGETLEDSLEAPSPPPDDAPEPPAGKSQ